MAPNLRIEGRIIAMGYVNMTQLRVAPDRIEQIQRLEIGTHIKGSSSQIRLIGTLFVEQTKVK